MKPFLAFSVFCSVLTASYAQQTNTTVTATNDVDLIDLSKNKAEWPAEVKLTEKITWPVIIGSKERGTTELPAGTILELIEVQGKQLKVSRGEVVKMVPSMVTDICLRVLTIRNEQTKTALAAMQREKERRERQERQEWATNVVLSALAKDRAEWPKEVSLTERIPLKSERGGPVGLVPPKTLRLLKVMGDEVNVEVKLPHGTMTKVIPTKSTDLVERVLAARQAQISTERVKDGTQNVDSTGFSQHMDRLKRQAAMLPVVLTRVGKASPTTGSATNDAPYQASATDDQGSEWLLFFDSAYKKSLEDATEKTHGWKARPTANSKAPPDIDRTDIVTRYRTVDVMDKKGRKVGWRQEAYLDTETFQQRNGANQMPKEETYYTITVYGLKKGEHTLLLLP